MMCWGRGQRTDHIQCLYPRVTLSVAQARVSFQLLSKSNLAQLILCLRLNCILHLCCSGPPFNCTRDAGTSVARCVCEPHTSLWISIKVHILLLQKKSSCFKENRFSVCHTDGWRLFVEVLEGHFCQRKQRLLQQWLTIWATSKPYVCFSISCVLPVWHYRTTLYVLCIRKSLPFCDLHQSSPILPLQKLSFNDNFFVCVARCHVGTLRNYQERIPSSGGTILCQSHKAPLWAPSTVSLRLLISDSHQSHQTLLPSHLN